MKRSQPDSSEVESSRNASCKARRRDRDISMRELPEDVLVTLIKHVTNEKLDRRKRYRLNYKAINEMTSPELFPVIPHVDSMALLSTCRDLKKIGHQLFKVDVMDGIPILQQSSARSLMKNPAFPIYLSYCVQDFHDTIQVLRLPYIEHPQQLSKILDNKSFPYLRELRFTELPQLKFHLPAEIVFSSRLSKIDVSSPSEISIFQLLLGFPALEALILRDLKYNQLQTLFKNLEHRSCMADRMICTSLKYISLNMQCPNKSNKVDSREVQTIYIREFMEQFSKKGRTVFKDLEYFHISALTHKEILVEQTRNYMKSGTRSNFAPEMVLDIGLDYCSIHGVYIDRYSLGQQIIALIQTTRLVGTAEQWTREMPRRLKYSTTIEISSYEYLRQFLRELGRMIPILKAISKLDLPFLQKLSLPFPINRPGPARPPIIRCVLSAITIVLTHVPCISHLEVSSEALESGNILKPNFNSFTKSLVNLKAIHFRRPDQIGLAFKESEPRRSISYERNSILLARLPDFLNNIRHCRQLEEIEIEVTQTDRVHKKPNKERSKLSSLLELLKKIGKEMVHTDLSSVQKLVERWHDPETLVAE